MKQNNKLKVQILKFSEIDINDAFFNSLREDYGIDEFNSWFKKKNSETVYVQMSELNTIEGFLYLKTECDKEDYSNINPKFKSKNRLKIGTFKIIPSGYKLNEYFFKMIFDKAIEQNIDEIYFTILLSDNESDKLKFIQLANDWGFEFWGVKNINEKVYLKKLIFNKEFKIKQNYPIINYKVNKYILPIKQEFHELLLSDYEFYENDKFKREAIEYALEKIYLSFSYDESMSEGDIILFYRMSKIYPKKDNSYISCIGVVTEIERDLDSKSRERCKNITAYSDKQLDDIFNEKRKITLIRFIIFSNLKNKIYLSRLQEKGIVEEGKGPRPFTKIDDITFNDFRNHSNNKIL